MILCKKRKRLAPELACGRINNMREREEIDRERESGKREREVGRERGNMP